MTTATLPWYCSKSSSKYGAPMGRTSYGCISDAPDGSLTIVKLPMSLTDRCYDLGGAYWGHRPTDYIWCVFNDDQSICRYERAASEAEALKSLGIKPEQVNPHPSIHPAPEPELFLDLSGAREIEVTTLVNAFRNEDDYDSLMMSAGDFCLPGPGGRDSWRYALEQVENWQFTDALYAALEEKYISTGCWEEGELDRPSLRGMLLQFVAQHYDLWSRHYADSDSFDEWLEGKDSDGELYAGDNGKYYLYLGS